MREYPCSRLRTVVRGCGNTPGPPIPAWSCGSDLEAEGLRSPLQPPRLIGSDDRESLHPCGSRHSVQHAFERAHTQRVGALRLQMVVPPARLHDGRMKLEGELLLRLATLDLLQNHSHRDFPPQSRHR